MELPSRSDRQRHRQGSQRLSLQDAARTRSRHRARSRPCRRGRHPPTPPTPDRRPASTGQVGPRALTDRESEILALITQGEQPRGRCADVLVDQHDQVVHPFRLPQDRRQQPHPSRAVGHRTRLQAGLPPHRPLARRALSHDADDRRLAHSALHARRGMTPSRSGPRSSAESDSSSTPSRWPTATWSSVGR